MKGEELNGESSLFANISGGDSFDYSQNVSRQWRRLVVKAGLGQKIDYTGWLELHLHVLRKYFQTKCKGAGIESSYYDFWMGHTGGETLDDSYWREAEKRHLEEYRKAIPHLNVFESEIDEESAKRIEEKVRKEMLEIMECRDKKFLRTLDLTFKELDEYKGRVRELEEKLKEYEHGKNPTGTTESCDVVQVPKHDLRSYMKYRKQGYRNDFVNDKHVIMVKERSP